MSDVKNEKVDYSVPVTYYERENKEQVGLIDTLDTGYLSHLLYEAGKPKNTPKMSISVLGYRHLEQTKTCVESVLHFVGTIDYELLLVDNASEDNNATLEYFQSVPTLRKKIVQVKEAMGTQSGSVFGTQLMYQYATGDIFVFLGNDNIITENALQNMLACLESDTSIGLVTPMSSNAYMVQNPFLKYTSREEMFAVAKEFNQYDPRKWQERLLIATVATAVKKHVLVEAGFYDYYSAEAGLLLRIRQAGYKTLLLGDTWVCHDHNYGEKKETHAWLSDTEEARRGLELSDKWFEKRMGGLEKFGDIMFFEIDSIGLLDKQKLSQNPCPDLLAVDVRSGQGLLDLKNALRKQGVFDCRSVAFTTKYKYHHLLDTAADEVFCDRIEFIQEHLDGYFFDYILLGEPLNLYAEPLRLLKKLLRQLKPGGQLLIKIRNTADVQTLAKMLGQANSLDPDMPVHIAFTDIAVCLKIMGINNYSITAAGHGAAPETINTARQIIVSSGLVEEQDVQNRLDQLLTREYLWCITK